MLAGVTSDGQAWTGSEEPRAALAEARDGRPWCGWTIRRPWSATGLRWTAGLGRGRGAKTLVGYVPHTIGPPPLFCATSASFVPGGRRRSLRHAPGNLPKLANLPNVAGLVWLGKWGSAPDFWRMGRAGDRRSAFFPGTGLGHGGGFRGSGGRGLRITRPALESSHG